MNIKQYTSKNKVHKKYMTITEDKQKADDRGFGDGAEANDRGSRLCLYHHTDMWTSRNGSSFIAITLHYLTKEFRMRSFTLEVAPFVGEHSG